MVERCQILPSRKATKDEIMLLHSDEHYKLLEKTSGINDDTKMEDLSSQFDSVYIHPVSFTNHDLMISIQIIIDFSNP